MKHFSDKSQVAAPIFFITICSFFLFILIAGILVPQINAYAGLSFDADTLNKAQLWQRQYLRGSLMLNNFFSYAATAILTLLICFRGQALSALKYRSPTYRNAPLFVILLFAAAIPLVIYISWLNLQIPLPDWAVQDEERINTVLGTVLKMETPAEFFLAFTAMAVTPAIGEELIYRGVIQRHILGSVTTNHHISIWIAAAIFSAAHAELAGFLPRLLLGAVLGYSYYWSSSIWAPIFLHLLFNGAQVINVYLSGTYTADTEMTSPPAWWVGLLGLVATMIVWRFGEQYKAAAGADAGVEGG